MEYLNDIYHKIKINKYELSSDKDEDFIFLCNSTGKEVELLNELLQINKVSTCHGIEHALTVMCHAFNALKFIEINNTDKINVLLAALLHDSDDHKFFPTHTNYENLRNILKQTYKNEDEINQIVFMVSIVSASKWGDKIPDDVIDKEWMLIPRYADRIEAIGLIGIERCYIFNQNVSKTPLYVPSTPKPIKEEDIWENATNERYLKYKGNSDSMIDHYYDKLLHITKFPIRNQYFDLLCDIRRKPLIDFLLFFGRKESLTPEDVEKFISEY